MRLAIAALVISPFVLVGCDRFKSSSSGAASSSPSAPAAPATVATAAVGSARAGTRTVASSAPVVGDQVKAKCELKAAEVKGDKDTARLVECPAGCASVGSVWGTDLYTDDSAVCAALIHAGVVPPAGGKAAITFVRGQTTYLGTARNGVASQSYGKWARSFYGQPIHAANKPTGPAPVVLDDTTARLACGDSSSVLEGATGAVWHVICPSAADCGEGTVWGSGPYTADSAVCRAAKQAGIVKGDQVDVKLTFGGKQESFKGSTANGVTSEDYGPYERTYTLSKMP